MSPTDVSSRNLAAALAERLAHIVPRGFSVRSEDTDISVYRDGKLVGGSAALEIINDDDGRGLDERIEVAVQAVVSGIQDDIIETIKGPWPGTSTRGVDLPMPDCRVTDDQLRVWFGDEKAPVASVPPISLR
jgi:hypothetical protein